MLPNAGAFAESEGLILDHSAAASDALLDDLRSDEGMEWVPDEAWLTKVAIDVPAGGLDFDLAIDASGAGSRPRSTPATPPSAPTRRPARRSRCTSSSPPRSS